MIALSLEQALAEMSAEELRSRIEQEIAEDLERDFQRTFGEPRIEGVEWLETLAGHFAAVHVADSGPGGEIHYWLSPDVPGGILRIVRGPVESAEAVAELTQITTGNRSEAPAGEIPFDMDGGPPESEGSPQAPVRLAVGDYHEGSVAPGGVSYYRVSVTRRADVYVEVTGLAGDAELYDYGADATFTDWLSASGGATLDAQFYYAPAGSDLYFTINDIEEEIGPGERYLVVVSDDPVVDPIGVRRQLPFQEIAEPLQGGVSVFRSLGPDGISLFEVESSGTRLTVTVVGLADGIGLRWLNLLGGNYESVVTTREGGTAILELSGVTPGATAYFYLAGDPDIPARDRAFQLRINVAQ
jgi:hypothetical protein